MLDQIRIMEDLAGKDAMCAALEALPEEHRAELSNVMPVSWLSTDACNGYISAVAHRIGRQPEDLLVEIVQRGVERTMTGLWRIILKFTSDAALVKRTPLIYSKTYDVGAMTSRIEVPGRAEIDLDGWPGVPRMELIGLAKGIETVLRCAGRRDVSVRWERRPRGAFFQATWTV